MERFKRLIKNYATFNALFRLVADTFLKLCNFFMFLMIQLNFFEWI